MDNEKTMRILYQQDDIDNDDNDDALLTNMSVTLMRS